MGFAESAGKFFVYKTLFDTVIYTDWAIKKSLKSAIPLAYKDNRRYNPMSPSQNEQEASYYTENAVFRTVVLWDILAQLYNAKHNIESDTSKIFYKKFFKKQIAKFDALNANIINAYIEQSENIDVEPWEGNHEYINDYRNQMTHRNSPNISTLSNYSSDFRMPARFVLKRAVEDYSAVSGFICSFINSVDLQHLLVFE